MAHGIMTLEQLTYFVESGEVDTVITAVCDMQGRLVGKRVTGHHFIEHCLDHGTHFCTYLLGTDMDLTTPEGFRDMTWESGYGDYIAEPDWSTIRLIPWLENTALVLCDAVDETTDDLVPVAPRSILRRQIDRLAGLGHSANMATELEFYVLTQSYQQAHQQGYINLTPTGWFNEDYQLLQATRNEPLYRRFRNEMSAAGVPIEFSKGEAAPGQHEVNIHYSDALTAADRAALFKHGAKEIADQQGNAITFMAKPYQHWTGSSGHIHVSLWDEQGDASVFPTEPGSREMSDTMRWFLGGQIAHAREFSLLIASTINAYKRFATASWAPVNIVWGRDNRTCGFRVVGSGNALRIENRLPGGDANPYLAFAAVLAAGMDGIERQIEPPAEFVGNGYEAKGHPRVPRSLAEAIDCWTESEPAVAAFGEEVHAHYLTAARIEQNLFESVVTDWERLRYLERG
jgi:glutamine synthetase